MNQQQLGFNFRGLCEVCGQIGQKPLSGTFPISRGGGYMEFIGEQDDVNICHDGSSE